MVFGFKLVSGIILLSADIEGKKGFVAFDTGAMHTALNSNYFERNGKKKKTVKFNGDTQESSSVESDFDISIENYTIKNTLVVITDLNYVEKSLRAADKDICFLGSLGYDIIKEHLWKIDYKNKLLYMDEEDSIKKHSHVVELESGSLPVTTISINDNNYKFVIDTGANTCLLDNEIVGIKFNHVNDSPNIVSISELILNDIKYNDIVAVLNDISSIKEVIKINGIIGYQILKDFICIFDFKNNKLYLD